MHRLIWPTTAARWLGFAVLGLSLAAVFVGTVVPSAAIGWIRAQIPVFASIWDSLDRLLPLLNPLHILLYAWIAVLWRLLAPGWPRWSILLLGSAFAGFTEALQILSAGRTSRFSDVINDVAGILLGLVLATIIEWIRQRSDR